MKQPDETKIEKRNTDDIKSASTEKKRKRPTERLRKRKPPFRSPDTAEQHIVNTIRAGNRLGQSSITFRRLVREAFERKCDEALGISKNDISTRIKNGIEGKHRSTVHRWFQAGLTDYNLNIPLCQLNCNCHEALRTKVEDEHHRTVLDMVLELKGSYQSIQAKDIVEIATDKGFLKVEHKEEPGPDEELDADNTAWVDDHTDQEPTKVE